MGDRSARLRVAVVLAAITAGAFALRLWGLGYGLPAVYNPDEMPILSRALAFAKGDPNPHNFLYPSLYFYALFIWEGLYFAVGRLVGWYGSLAAFEREFFVDPSHIMLAGRALTAVCGTLTVPVLYRFGSTLYDRATGLCAALFLAVAPFAVRDSHYVKHDVPTTLFVALTLAALARIVVDPRAAVRVRSWLLAGVLAGLAMSTHYYAIVVVVPVVVVAVATVRPAGGWRPAARLLVWAGIASVLGFFAASPFLLVEPGTAVRDMVAVRQIDLDRAVVGHHAFVSLGRYIEMLATDAIGWPVCLLGAGGTAVALMRDWRRGLLLASFPLAFLGFLANTVPMNRYLNAMLPSVALAAAFLVTRVSALAGRARPVAAGVLAAGAAWPGLAGSVRSDQFFRQDDTRTLAEAFIEREVPPGATLLVQPYTAPVRPSRESLVEALRAHLGSETRASVKFQRELALSPYPAPAYRTIYLGEGGEDADKLYLSPHAFDDGGGSRALAGLQVEYVVLKQYNEPNPAFASLRAALVREGRLIATFSPYGANVTPDRRMSVAPFLHNTDARIDSALERPGPTIEVWRITR